jgi:diacylglycerol O-acyltransferase / wax synthase
VSTTDRMTALDTWFLHVEDDVNHMHIGSVGIFEGPVPDWAEMRDAIGSKLDLIPRYRQRYRDVGLGLARPIWVDDPHFQLDYHVRHTALPRPGTHEQLRRLVGRIMGQQLDRHRPLWETWFVEGLADERWAMISKVHHCVVDGIAGADLLAIVLEADPEARPSPVAPFQPAAAPTRRAVATEVVRSVAARPVEALRVVGEHARDPLETASRGVAAVRGAGELAGIFQPMPRTSLTGPIGPHRRWATALTDLDEAKAVKRALGGTVNDVILAAITNCYRELLRERDELSSHAVVRTMVPVSLRGEDRRGELHNRVAALFVPLPVGADEPAERYRAVRDTMAETKVSGEHVTTAALVGASGLAPTMFVGLALRTVSQLLQRSQRYVTTVTTNVPGPQQPQYLLGRRMLEAYPYVPIAEGVRTGVAIFSYDGQLAFGVTADFDEVPDVEVLTDGIEHGMADLVGLVS